MNRTDTPDQELPPKKPRLHSPILEGDERLDAGDKRLFGKGQNKSKLRSPLLGGEEAEVEKVAGAKHGHLHSPLLGNQDANDYEEDFPLRDRDHSSFPHRSRSLNSHEKGETQQQPRLEKPQLRSPLLNADGSNQYMEARKEEPTYEEIEDPNVLRSPLLAARVTPPATPPITPLPSMFPHANHNSTELEKIQDQSVALPGTKYGAQGEARSARRKADITVQQPAVNAAADPETALHNNNITHLPIGRPSGMQDKSNIQGSVGEHGDEFSRSAAANAVAPTFRNSGQGLLQQAAQPAAEHKPLMLLLVPTAMAVIAKIWFLVELAKANQLSSLPVLADQGTQLIVLLSLVIFAMNGGKVDKS